MDAVADTLKSGLANRYRIKRELGRGGMATVYLAEDVRHHRDVAVKVLHPELAAVIGAERFLREIEIAASLTNPHILPLHESGQFDHLLFYVMPYIAGESLRDRLRREKQLPVEQAARLAAQVARGLAHAHEHGVIHRDIKPENILLAGEDAVVTDFGIARAVRAAGGERLTQTGLSLGTPHYMSPEQAAGDADVDARTDVYSLGCVLYEMLAGAPPFTGPNVQAIIAKVLTGTPEPVNQLRPTVPASLAVVVHKAIARLPADRYANATQLAEAISRAMEPGTANATVTAVGESQLKGLRVSPIWPVVSAVVAASLVWMFRSTETSSADPVRLSIDYPSGYSVARGTPSIAISPNGRLVAFVARDSVDSRLLVRAIDDFDVRILPGTEGASSPFFSPDDQWIGYIAAGSIFRVAVGGGRPVHVADAPFVGLAATWAPGRIVVGGSGGLMSVPETGGTLEPLTPSTVRDSSILQSAALPNVLPDGKHVLVTVIAGSEYRSAVVSIETGGVQVIEGLQGAMGARRWRDSVVYAMGDELFVAPFDWKRRKLTGTATMLQNDVFGTRGGPFFSLAGNGTLAFVPGSWGAGVNHVVWADRSGTVTRVNEYLGQHLYPRLSPDGRRVAVQEGGDVWVYDERGTRTKVTEGGGTDPVWSADGRSVTFAAFEGSYRSIHSVAADGSDRALLFSGKHSAFPHSWSPDGQALAIYQVTPDSARDIFVLRRDRTTFVVDSFLVTQHNERSPVFSKDGKWIAYMSDESGTDEIYVRPYPRRGGKWTISRGGGREPVWGRDGKTLYFRRGTEIVSVAIELRDGDLSAGEQRVVTTVGDEIFSSVSGSQSYDVSPDGQRLLTTASIELPAIRSLRVVVGLLKP